MRRGASDVVSMMGRGDDDVEQEAASSSGSASGSPETVLNAYLIDIGVPEQDVERLVNSAVAWRMTPGGRPLIDRPAAVEAHTKCEDRDQVPRGQVRRAAGEEWGWLRCSCGRRS